MKPYLPTKSDEGIAFEEAWCDKCVRHSLDPNAKTQCIHLGRAVFGEDNKRWYVIDGKPTCLAFRSKKEAYRNRKTKKDEKQMELF